MPKDNEATVRALYDAFNAHDAVLAAATVAEDATDWDRPAGRAQFAAAFGDAIARFPDARLEPKEVLAAGDEVIVRAVYSGTHRGVGRLDVDGGQMIGVAPTGRRFEVLHMAWWSLKGGRIVARRARADEASMLMQLGLIPPKPPSDRPAGLDDPPIAHRAGIGGPEQLANEAAVRASMAAQNGRDLEGTVAMYAPDTRNHGRPVGREAFERSSATSSRPTRRSTPVTGSSSSRRSTTAWSRASSGA
jgi:predicted ester cyclase